MSIFTKLTGSSSTGIINALFAAINASKLNPFVTANDLAYKVPFDVFGFKVSQIDAVAPTLTFLGGSATPTNQQACRPGTCPYTRADGSVFCTAAACKHLDYVSAGVYRFTFDTAPKFGFGVLMSPPESVNTRYNIVYESASSFLIKTFNAAVAENNLLSDTYLEIKIYN